jgi:hypothetical protein
MKVVSGHLYSHKGELLEDLAWDFIAELFERDSKGTFIILADNFELSELENSSKEDIEQWFRRIIVTKVDDNIFRSNGEKDPSLKKIIRNLKNAVKKNPCKGHVYVQNGYLCFPGNHKEDTSPLLSASDILEIQLCHRIHETMQMPDVLAEVVHVLETFQLRQNKISLVAVAICIRKAFVHINDREEKNSQVESPAEILHHQAIEKKIELSAEHIKRTLGEKYIHKKVLTRNELNLFMLAVKEILRLELVDKHDESNHFECLKRYHTDMKYLSYREQYRPVLEYLVKKTRDKIVAFYEKEWS